MSTTISYVLAPEHQRRYVYPSSYGAAAGTPIVGGLIYTYESTAKTTLMPTYSSNIGSPPPLNTNPIVLDDNGECVIYWAFNSLLGPAASNLYYVELRDPNGVLLDSYDMYNGVPYPAGSIAVQAAPLNLVTNPQFSLDHFGKSSSDDGSILDDQFGGGYTLNIVNSQNCYVADDWIWTKSNDTTSETVALIPFTQGQTSVPFSPVNYLEWNVDSPGSGETYKSIFQTYYSVNTFANQMITFQFMAKSSTSSTINVNMRQYYGTGGSPSVTNVVPGGSFPLTAEWALYENTISIPLTTGGVIGTNDDDGILFCFDLPLNAAGGTTIDLCNVDIKLSNSLLTFQYTTINIQSTETDRDWFGTETGQIQSTILTAAQNTGWLYLQDGTIGNAVSGATDFANENAYGIYNYLWMNTANAQCAVLPAGSGATATASIGTGHVTAIAVNTSGINYSDLTNVIITGGSGTGATATATVVDGTITAITVTAGGTGYTGVPTITFGVVPKSSQPYIDFDLGKTINLPLNLNRFNVAAGSAYVLGQTGGAGSITEVPAHLHTFGEGGNVPAADAGFSPQQNTGVPGPGIPFTGGTVANITSTLSTGSASVATIPPYTAFYDFMKL